MLFNYWIQCNSFPVWKNLYNTFLVKISIAPNTHFNPLPHMYPLMYFCFLPIAVSSISTICLWPPQRIPFHIKDTDITSLKKEYHWWIVFIEIVLLICIEHKFKGVFVANKYINNSKYLNWILTLKKKDSILMVYCFGTHCIYIQIHQMLNIWLWNKLVHNNACFLINPCSHKYSTADWVLEQIYVNLNRSISQ